MVTESPTVARRQLRQALRRARDAKSLTQGQVAEALEWSLSKVNRIESGDVTISNTDLRALLALLEINRPEVVNTLVETGRVARRRYDAHPNVTPAMRNLFQFEREAVTIRCFQPTLVVGLFQTQAYAESILDFWNDVLSGEERESRLQMRVERRKNVIERENPPAYLLVLDESVVHRVVGNAAITAEQFTSLVQRARAGQVDVRILPFADGLPLSMIGAFTIIDLPGEDAGVMYTEAPRTDDFVEDPQEIDLHRRYFELMWGRSHSRQASIEFIENASSRLLDA